jgi:hypothetical protein
VRGAAKAECTETCGVKAWENKAGKVSAMDVFRSQASCQKSVILPSPRAGFMMDLYRDSSSWRIRARKESLPAAFNTSACYLRNQVFQGKHSRIKELMHKFEEQAVILISELSDAKAPVFFRLTNSVPSQQTL